MSNFLVHDSKSMYFLTWWKTEDSSTMVTWNMGQVSQWSLNRSDVPVVGALFGFFCRETAAETLFSFSLFFSVLNKHFSCFSVLKDVHCFNIDPVAWKSLSHPAAGFGYQVVQRRSKWVGSVFHWMTNIICHKYFFQPACNFIKSVIRSETGFLSYEINIWFGFASLVCLSVPLLNNIQEMEGVKYFHAQLWAAHLFKVRISLIYQISEQKKSQ